MREIRPSIKTLVTIRSSLATALDYWRAHLKAEERKRFFHSPSEVAATENIIAGIEKAMAEVEQWK
jgi:hypothetical protein